MDKFDSAQEIRQRILDYANEVGSVSSSEIAKNLEGINLEHAYRSLSAMTENGEMLKHGTNRNVRFTPVKLITTSAAEMRALQQIRHRNGKAAQMEVHRTRSMKNNNKQPWRTVHLGSEREHPIQNQGGQGNLRQKVTIHSCMD